MCSFSRSLGSSTGRKASHTGDAPGSRPATPVSRASQTGHCLHPRDFRSAMVPVIGDVMAEKSGHRKLFPAAMRRWVVRARGQCLSCGWRARQSRSLRGDRKIPARDAGCRVVASRSRRVVAIQRLTLVFIHDLDPTPVAVDQLKLYFVKVNHVVDGPAHGN